MYEEIIALLKFHGVEFETGLTENEIKRAEAVYEIQFPESLRAFLSEGLPVSSGFYNWRNVESDNVAFMKEMISRPIKDIDDLAEEVYWCDDWGEEPESESEIGKRVREKLKSAPKLVPVYLHRYIPALREDDPPVVSIHDTDIIYFGENLKSYFEIEFGKKKYSEICFDNIKSVPFWSEIM